MVLAGLQFEKIHHVDEADFHVGKLLSQQRGRSQGLLGRYVTGGGHDHVGFNALVVAGPVPNTYALGAVFNRGIHIEVLEV
jgi:hypothetical protein